MVRACAEWPETKLVLVLQKLLVLFGFSLAGWKMAGTSSEVTVLLPSG